MGHSLRLLEWDASQHVKGCMGQHAIQHSQGTISRKTEFIWDNFLYPHIKLEYKRLPHDM